MSALIIYQDAERSWKSIEEMVSEVIRIAGRVEKLRLSPGQVERSIVGVLSSALIARYGPEIGYRLLREFFSTFDYARRMDADIREGLIRKKARSRRTKV